MYYGHKEENDECELEPAYLEFNEPSDTEETELDKQELLMVSVIRLVLRHFLPLCAILQHIYIISKSTDIKIWSLLL